MVAVQPLQVDIARLQLMVGSRQRLTGQQRDTAVGGHDGVAFQQTEVEVGQRIAVAADQPRAILCDSAQALCQRLRHALGKRCTRSQADGTSE